MTDHLAQTLRSVRGERGSMLVLALLVLLALTSVAMVAVQNVNSELRYAGNARKGAAAYRVTEGGAFTSLAWAEAVGPGAFVSRVNQSLATSGSGYAVLDPGDLVTESGTFTYFDMGPTGSFGYEGHLEQGSAQPGKAPFDFEVRVTPTGMRQPLVGYGASGAGSRCRFKYQLDSVGHVGTDATGAAADATWAAWKQIRTLQFVGPLPCDQVVQGNIPTTASP
ncbi:MAG: hypothetical protein ACQEXJ_14925 [Myxococcota bacterium]